VLPIRPRLKSDLIKR